MTTHPAIPNVTLNNGVQIPQPRLRRLPSSAARDPAHCRGRSGSRLPPHRHGRGVPATRPPSAPRSLPLGIPREDIFLTTKLRNGEQGTAQEAFQNSRQELGVDYIDLYLIHWPVPSRNLFTDAWKAMEKLHASGAIRAIGVSNFLADHLDTLLQSADVVPAVNQFELHPTFQQPELAAKSRSLGIAVEAYSPLGQGADLDAAAVTSAADKYGVTPAQVVLAWHLAQGTIVIPKSANSGRMRDNLAAVGVVLTPAEIGGITALEARARIGSDPAVAAHSQM
jgi:2,5-diketo-D-gluconate reductase A